MERLFVCSAGEAALHLKAQVAVGNSSTIVLVDQKA
jgi:hypothetical protein